MIVRVVLPLTVGFVFSTREARKRFSAEVERMSDALSDALNHGYVIVDVTTYRWMFQYRRLYILHKPQEGQEPS